jgi:hypothetical protein
MRLVKKKCFLWLLSLLSMSGYAQQNKPRPDWKKKRVSVIGGLGLAIPTGKFNATQQIGFEQTSGVDYFISRSVFTRTLFEFSNTSASSETFLRSNRQGNLEEIKYGGFNILALSQYIGYRYPSWTMRHKPPKHGQTKVCFSTHRQAWACGMWLRLTTSCNA